MKKLERKCISPTTNKNYGNSELYSGLIATKQAPTARLDKKGNGETCDLESWELDKIWSVELRRSNTECTTIDHRKWRS